MAQNRLALALPDLPMPEAEHKASLKILLDEVIARTEKQLADDPDDVAGYDPDDQKSYILEAVRGRLETLDAAILTDAARLFAAAPGARAAEQLGQFFDNDPEATEVEVYTSDSVYDDLPDVLDQLEAKGKGNFLTVATTEPITQPFEETVAAAREPDKKKRTKRLAGATSRADKASRALDRSFRQGVPAQLLAPLPPGTFATFTQAMGAGGSLLGMADGREDIQVFVGWTADPDRNPDLAGPCAPMGAILARRGVLDRQFGVAEPMMADRGGKGVLFAGVLLDQWLKGQRDDAVKHGVNPLQRWGGVGEVVIDGDRTLLEGTGVYIYSSRVRLRNWIAARFYKTVAHELYGDGGGPEARLDKAVTAMNVFLQDLKDQKWITDGSVVADYGANDMTLNVALGMDPTRDKIHLVFSQIAKARTGS
jgi:hypothetical protein